MSPVKIIAGDPKKKGVCPKGSVKFQSGSHLSEIYSKDLPKNEQ